jgi:molecular chaperone GrpE (heat shock protein)
MTEIKAKGNIPKINEVHAELRFIETPEVPSAVVWHLISKSRKELQKVERNQQQQFNRFLANMSLPVFYLNRLVEKIVDTEGTDLESGITKRIQLIDSLLTSVLKKEGVKFMELDGRRWQDVDEGEAEMVDYIIDKNLPEPIVSDTCEPVVFNHDNIIKPAKVIVAGPPPETAKETED